MARTRGSDMAEPEASTLEVAGRLALGEEAGVLSAWARGLDVLTGALPGRATNRQLQLFAHVIATAAKGGRVTLADIRRLSDSVGIGANKAHMLFLEPTERDPTALGWLTQVSDPRDARKKYLALTDAGREIAVQVAEAVRL